MFDPSKLDLDLDNTKKKNIPASKDAIQKALNSVDTTKETIADNTKVSSDPLDNTNFLKDDSLDFLSDKKTDETTPKKVNSVHESFMADEAKRDKIKAQEKIIQEQKDQKIEENIIWDISDVINNNQKIEEAESKINTRMQLNTDLIDININSLQDILDILIKESYDLFILEPRDNDIKVSFRQEKVEKDVKYIKFPVYHQILLKAKALTKLQVEETKVAQEGKWEIQIREHKYKLMSKTVPSAFWEKILVKITELQKKATKTTQKKTSVGKLFWFLWIIAIIALLLVEHLLVLL